MPSSPPPANKQPFIDPDVGLHVFFPPRFYAIAIPTVLLVVFVGLVTLFIGLTMLKAASAEKQKKKEQKEELAAVDAAVAMRILDTAVGRAGASAVSKKKKKVT